MIVLLLMLAACLPMLMLVHFSEEKLIKFISLNVRLESYLKKMNGLFHVLESMDIIN